MCLEGFHDSESIVLEDNSISCNDYLNAACNGNDDDSMDNCDNRDTLIHLIKEDALTNDNPSNIQDNDNALKIEINYENSSD